MGAALGIGPLLKTHCARARRWWISCFAIAVLGLAPTITRADCTEASAYAVSVQGSVSIRRAGLTSWTALALDEGICVDDTVRVGMSSRAVLRLEEHTTMPLDEGSVLRVAPADASGNWWLELLRGAVHVITRVPRELGIRTPFVNAAVEGTEFYLRSRDDGAEIRVFDGRVRFGEGDQAIVINSGQAATAGLDGEPRPLQMVRPRQAVQWALYYPPIVYLAPESGAAPPEAQRAAIGAYRRGDVAGALDQLERVPPSERDGRWAVVRSAMLLSVGQVDRARRALSTVAPTDPAHGDALAIRSLVALVTGDRPTATLLSEQALGESPDSPITLMARSYVDQSHFDLSDARARALEATRLAPVDPLAWARLAELEQSLGRLSAGRDAAQRAQSLDPNLSRAQSVLGFALLTQLDPEAAASAFRKAIRLDSADPLPRLGLGLAQIRQGDLDDGRADIEIAASLDPSNSLIRSYLGKAYYEEKRETLAASEFKIAKALDPNDPTPWFYEAILRQSESRPVEALEDLRQSIDLNDNRAVYRSRLLLDDDFAARSASIARIYSDLGFDRRALLEGRKSVNTDPANYSAHRFLADAYMTLPRHEIARASEVLQSQLLQPINVAPLPPRLAETDLTAIEQGGPNRIGFNEFNPLFLENGLGLQVAGLAGGNETLGDEITQYGVFNRFSYSLGQYHFETDGIRDNNDLNTNVYNAFAQMQLQVGTSIQVEYRRSDRDQGQLDLLFGAPPLPVLRREQEEETYRIGLRHDLSPGATLLANLSYQDIGFQENRTTRDNTEISLVRDRDGLTLDVQYQQRWRAVDLIAGGRYLDQDFTQTGVVQLPPIQRPPFLPGLPAPPPIQPPPSNLPEEDDQLLDQSLYGYTLYRPTEDFTLIGGLSLETFERGDQIDQDQVNPKLGLIWESKEDTTIRASATRSLNATRYFTQTLEPTQVAGFNQIVDGIEGSDAWRYGIALEQSFGSSLFAGAQLSMARVSSPLLSASDEEAPYFDSREHFGHAYLYWAPNRRWALRAEYEYQKLENDPELTQVVVESTTHIVPLGISYFDPRGISVHLNNTYVDQEGDFDPDEIGSATISGRDSVWLTDLRLDYRLPRRWGIISAGVQNALDQEFDFQDVDPANPRYLPDRIFYVQATLAFD